jgi:hypothetical protein
MMDEGDEARSLPDDQGNKEDESLVSGGIAGEPNAGDLENLEMDPVYQESCDARRVMVRMLSEINRGRWTKANTGEVVRILNRATGSTAIDEIATCSNISGTSVRQILREHGLGMDARRVQPIVMSRQS